MTANVSNVQVTCSTNTFTVAGAVSGLASGQQVTLQNNGTNPVTVTANGSFNFSTPVAYNGSYAVTIGTQPTGQTCSVSNGSGGGITGSVTNVSVVCSANTYTIGGSAAGLALGSQLTLLNNGSNPLTLSSTDLSFTFSTAIPFGGSYSVTVGTQPVGQICSVTNGTGTNVSGNINNVSVACNLSTPQVSSGNLYVSEFPLGPFDLVNKQTGVLTAQSATSCGAISSSALGPDGRAIGTKSDGTFYRFDPVGGSCQYLFTAPEWLSQIAIASDGSIVGMSQATTFGARQIYRFSSSGTVLSKVALTGPTSMGGFAYAPDGNIYGDAINGINNVGWYFLNPLTGQLSLVASGNQLGLSQICIDSAGIAYGVSFGTLYKYTASTGVLIDKTVLQNSLSGLAAIVCR
jgi:hypothetical protein